MKKNLKVMLMSGIASVVTATIIFVSGGGVVIATLLGGTSILTIPSLVYLNDKRNNKRDTSYIEQTDNIPNTQNVIYNNEDLENDYVDILDAEKKEHESTQNIAPIQQYDDNLIIQKLITIDALSQKENVLVRIRKKETEEKYKENNEHKK